MPGAMSIAFGAGGVCDETGEPTGKTDNPIAVKMRQIVDFERISIGPFR